MTITVVGAGAIGGVLGAHLIKAGENVIFCDRAADHVDTMNKKGLTIESEHETFTVPCVAYTPAQLVERQEPLDKVFLCVKAQHTTDALSPLVPLLNDNAYVVSFQNGLCEREIASLVGRERTVGCFVNFSADYLGPGHILYGGVASLHLGELDGTISTRLLDLQETLKAWGPAQVTDNVWGFLWGKLSYAALLFGTALVDETMATVVRAMDYRPTLMELCSEILEVAEHERITPLGFDDWTPELVYPRETRNNEILDPQLEKLAARMAANKKTKSGIWRDLVIRKRKTEVSHQLEPIIDIGEKYGLKLPLTRQVVTQIHELEEGKRLLNWGNLEELKAKFEIGRNT